MHPTPYFLALILIIQGISIASFIPAKRSVLELPPSLSLNDLSNITAPLPQLDAIVWPHEGHLVKISRWSNWMLRIDSYGSSFPADLHKTIADSLDDIDYEIGPRKFRDTGELPITYHVGAVTLHFLFLKQGVKFARLFETVYKISSFTEGSGPREINHAEILQYDIKSHQYVSAVAFKLEIHI